MWAMGRLSHVAVPPPSGILSPAGLRFHYSLLKTLQLENLVPLGDSVRQILNLIAFSFRAFDPYDMRENCSPDFEILSLKEANTGEGIHQK